jgi:hypothetical protein
MSSPSHTSSDSFGHEVDVDYHPTINGKSYSKDKLLCFLLIVSYLIGKVCDRDGTPLSNPRPSPSSIPDSNDWAPFESHVASDLAHFFFKEDQMSATKIDRFLQIMANSLEVHNDQPPFTNHKDVYRMIDEIPVGGKLWQSFSFTYGGPKPEDTPKWMDAEYTVWFRDPHKLFLNMLKNPDFEKSFDYAPYQQYDKKGNCWYEHFMSGDWAWQQAVCILTWN